MVVMFWTLVGYFRHSVVYPRAEIHVNFVDHIFNIHLHARYQSRGAMTLIKRAMNAGDLSSFVITFVITQEIATKEGRPVM